MNQRNSTSYRLLNSSAVYNAVQWIIGGPRGIRILVEDYIKPANGDRILDIGCGTADVLFYLGDVRYTGIDVSSAYIDKAARTYGDKGTFHCAGVEEMERKINGPFNIVLAIAVLHHLDDVQAGALFRSADSLLSPGGRLITLDCAWTKPQNPLARLLIALDRGTHVRTGDQYLALAHRHFSHVSADTRNDLNRLPYTHFIMTCAKRASPAADNNTQDD